MLNVGADPAFDCGNTTIEYVAVFVCLKNPDSTTFTVNVEVPLAVGVPDNTPALESERPEGKLPDEIDQAYGCDPPVALNVTEYAVPTWALGSCVVRMARSSGLPGACEMVSETWLEEAPLAFRTCSCATVGCASIVPLIFAARVVEFTKVVGMAEPFTVKADCDSKFAPCTVTVTSGDPAVTTSGETWLIDGLTIANTVTPVPQPVLNRLTATPRAANFA